MTRNFIEVESVITIAAIEDKGIYIGIIRSGFPRNGIIVVYGQYMVGEFVVTFATDDSVGAATGNDDIIFYATQKNFRIISAK